MFSPGKAKSKIEKSVVICVGGMAGSGKSTLAKRIAGKYGLRYFSGGDALKALAVEKGYKSSERGWWESSEAMRFLEERVKDDSFDETVDRKLLQMACKGNVVLDSWTMPWLIEGAFKIWLEASPEKRAKRIAGRDRISFENSVNALKRKEEHTKEIYRRLYGFKLGEDLAPFNFILDTENLKSDEVFRIVSMVIDHVILKK